MDSAIVVGAGKPGRGAHGEDLSLVLREPEAGAIRAAEAVRALVAAGRAYVAQRFPALAGAPLRDATTCRYELTADSHFVAAEHPSEPGVWLVGGGSGPGFKHGPKRLGPPRVRRVDLRGQQHRLALARAVGREEVRRGAHQQRLAVVAAERAREDPETLRRGDLVDDLAIR